LDFQHLPEAGRLASSVDKLSHLHTEKSMHMFQSYVHNFHGWVKLYPLR